MAFKEFYSYKRDISININDFLHYEILYQKLQKFVMIILDGVQAIFVLNTANLSGENEK